MARKVKFALELKDGYLARGSVEEIRQHFDLEKIVGYFHDGRLVDWLRDHNGAEEANQVAALDPRSGDFAAALCRIFGVSEQRAAQTDAGEIAERYRRLERLKQYTPDAEILARIDDVAFTQAELDALLAGGKRDVILCGGAFEISPEVSGVTYRGVGKAEVAVWGTEKDDFAAQGIKFVNLEFSDAPAKTEKAVKVISAKQRETQMESKRTMSSIDDFKRAAEQGDANAMARLGVCYEKGIGVALDLAKAKEWYKKAAERGNGAAMNRLGEISDNLSEGAANGASAIADLAGIVSENSSGALARGAAWLARFANSVSDTMYESVGWFKKAAEAGNVPGMANLGDCYRLGKGVVQDLAQAKYWYKKAVEFGNGKAMNGLGELCNDPLEAVRWFKQAAEAGDTGGMTNFAACYQMGVGIEKDLAKAKEWYKKAAELGNSLAMNGLGNICDNPTEAVEWWRKSAEAGEAAGMANLGYCYLAGLEVEQDLVKAEEWYRKAAKLGNGAAMDCLGDLSDSPSEKVAWYKKAADVGDANGMADLGDCYQEGQGVEKDLVKAEAWYKKAAELGSGMAMNRLGLMSDNPSEAAAWYKQSAEAGFNYGMYNLGWCYKEGQGIPQNLFKAEYWLKKALEAGIEDAKEELAKLGR